jgi:hypothetical protein
MQPARRKGGATFDGRFPEKGFGFTLSVSGTWSGGVIQSFSLITALMVPSTRDTVSSVGLARQKKSLPETTDGMGYVCFFRHALALDERRVKFLPEFVCGGSSREPGMFLDDRYCKELWFAGTHSDMYVMSTPRNIAETSIAAVAEIARTRTWILAHPLSGGWFLRHEAWAFE